MDLPPRLINERKKTLKKWYLYKTINTRKKGKKTMGCVEEIGAEGFEPPTLWSQTRCASQTALYPEKDGCRIHDKVDI